MKGSSVRQNYQTIFTKSLCRCLLLTSFFHTMGIFKVSSDNWQRSRITLLKRVPKRNSLQADCSILKTLFLHRIPRLFIPFRHLDTSSVFIISNWVFIRRSSFSQGWSEIETRGTDRGRKNPLANAVPKTMTELHLDLDVSLGVIGEKFKCETKLSD